MKGVEFMSFRIETTMKGYEFRTLVESSFKDDDGNRVPYMTMVVENVDNCDQSRVSVPSDLRDMVRSLNIRRGMLVDLRVLASAGSSYSKLQLVDLLD